LARDALRRRSRVRPGLVACAALVSPSLVVCAALVCLRLVACAALVCLRLVACAALVCLRLRFARLPVIALLELGARSLRAITTVAVDDARDGARDRLSSATSEPQGSAPA
jgi:predicted membrane metal-binding protein